MSTQETKPEPRRPKLRLPFDNRREDAGEWAFDHRAGLCVTLIAYLLLAIAFVGAKIVVGGRPAAQGFYIDLQQLEQLAAEKERLEREVRRMQGTPRNGKAGSRRVGIGCDSRKGRRHRENHVL